MKNSMGKLFFTLQIPAWEFFRGLESYNVPVISLALFQVNHLTFLIDFDLIFIQFS